jgi:hypothetical protein
VSVNLVTPPPLHLPKNGVTIKLLKKKCRFLPAPLALAELLQKKETVKIACENELTVCREGEGE